MGTIAGLSLMFLVTAVSRLAPQPGEPVAAFLSPSLTEADALSVVAAADGAVLRFGAASWIVVGTSDDPDFTARLYRVGAWLVVDALAAGLCGPQTPWESRS